MKTVIRLNRSVALACCAWLCLSVLTRAGPVLAGRAFLVIDAKTGAVLHAKNPRLLSYPASLTKLMTVYLLLQAVETGQVTLEQKLAISKAAAGQPPTKLDLKPGGTITAGEALAALIVGSANDAAVAVAEHLAGSEAAFAEMMTSKAQALGMPETVFRNASGLPNPGQYSTARDMAVLARALFLDFSQHDHLFSMTAFPYGGKTISTTNSFINSFEGADGLKTGFTCHAGYNLVASAERDGRRLIGVVLGEENLGQRNTRMAELFNTAFAQKLTDESGLTVNSLIKAPNPSADQGLNREALAKVCIVGERVSPIGRVSEWGLAVGVGKDRKEAVALASKTVRQYSQWLARGRPLAIPFLRKVLLYRAFITNLDQNQATEACRQMRQRYQYCIVTSPQTAEMDIDQGQIALKRARALQRD